MSRRSPDKEGEKDVLVRNRAHELVIETKGQSVNSGVGYSPPTNAAR